MLRVPWVQVPTLQRVLFLLGARTWHEAPCTLVLLSTPGTGHLAS